MHRLIILTTVIAGLVMVGPLDQLRAQETERSMIATETRIPVGNTTLYSRAIGQGTPVIVLHGGPDFDHGYLLPELDRLSDTFRLIYYDQRGRGRSAENVRPQDVTLASDLDDIDRVRRHHELDAVVLLGHSWGAVLAVEYALRNPTRVSHLILMNPAPVSVRDLAAVRKAYLERLGEEVDRQRAIAASAAYQAGDPETVATRYRIHFQPSLKRAEDYERMMARMKAGFLTQGKDGIVKARAVEDQLMRDTWEVAGYDLLPKLAGLGVPTLVIAGDHDFMIGAAESIAGVIPRARLVTIKDCGHFAFLECAGEVRNALDSFLGREMKATEPKENEIVLERTFDAPRERVFSALTQSDQITRWMKPSAMPLVGCEFDLRAGGSFRYVFQRPNGRKIEVRGVIEEVDAPSRFSYVETYDFSPLRIHVTTELQKADERTLFKQKLVYASKAERDVDYPGVAASSEEVFANLERYLARVGK